ncbi:DUF58 domain-containing protein [Clostridium faecium]|uniref:DUF58 domain-containing protein n=1 Tax=Clostridium faecium TaxID=2762223 RepID=A0ABR8YVI5_9CLOT|nr:DUF58 domain-containing protein [Clostridium faecium]MBD8048250.1 DUF58 domain-containing protein [Clostridium faecium]
MIKVNVKFILLTIAACIFAKVSGGNLPYSVFYSLFIMLIISIMYIYLSLQYVQCKIKHNQQEYSVGDEDEFSLIISNESFIPIPYVEVVNNTFTDLIKTYKGDAFFLQFNSDKWLKRTITFNKRGIYDFGTTTIKVTDLFNVITSNKNINHKLGVKVYPKIYNIKLFKLSGSEKLENLLNSDSKVEDLTLIKDIRQYRIGDSLKRVHWKISAKQGELYVKNYDYISGTQCNLFLDMKKIDFSNKNEELKEEMMIDFTSSLLKKFVDLGIKSKIYINNSKNEKIEVENSVDFSSVMEYFLFHNSNGEGDFIDFINGSLNSLGGKSFLCIITCNVNSKLKDELLHLKNKGYNVSLFYYNNYLGLIEEITFLTGAGINCYDFKEIIKNSL